MKNTPINNGKDVPEIKTQEIHTIGGIAYVAKLDEALRKSPLTYEPKRNNRWLIKFKGAYKDIPSWSIKKTHRPKLINGSWGELKIELYDVISPSVSQALMDGFRYDWQKRNRKNPIVNYSLEMLDPTGVTIEKWDIEGKVKEADFGKLDYKNSKASNIKLTIDPLNVILEY